MTDDLIRIMAADCAATGDYLQAAICRIALGEPWHDLPLGDADRAHVSGIGPETAREMAEDVLDDVGAFDGIEPDDGTVLEIVCGPAT